MRFGEALSFSVQALRSIVGGGSSGLLASTLARLVGEVATDLREQSRQRCLLGARYATHSARRGEAAELSHFDYQRLAGAIDIDPENTPIGEIGVTSHIFAFYEPI